MIYKYDDYVTKFSDNFIRVIIDEDYVEKISFFVNKIIEEKASEDHHKIDKYNESKRFTTGLLGEAALEKLLGIKIIDWSIGYSGFYNTPDIPGYAVGVKTVEKGKFPIIFKKNDYPQIICIKSDKKENLIFVCGLATPQILNSCQDTSLILSPNLRARGTKTGFYGFEHLIQISSLKDIEKYKK